MILLLATAGSALLFLGFLALMGVEASRGTRVFPQLRSKLDAAAAGLFAFSGRADLPAALWHALKDGIVRLAQMFVAFAIIGLRAIERALVRVARYLRDRERAGLKNLANRGSAFVEHITRHKRSLRGDPQTPPAPGETTGVE